MDTLVMAIRLLGTMLQLNLIKSIQPTGRVPKTRNDKRNGDNSLVKLVKEDYYEW